MGETSLLIPFPFKRTTEASQGFLQRAFALSAGFCLSPGRWLAGAEALGSAPGLPRAAFGEGIALPLCVVLALSK